MKFRRVTKQKPCLICGHSSWCGLSDDGMVAVCMRTESDRKSKNGGYVHFLKDAERKPLPSRPPIHSHERADANHLDFIYNLLLEKLVLAYEHRDKLISRGLARVDIAANNYKSVPTDVFAKGITHSLTEQNLRGVPGFYRENNQWRMVNPGKGFFVPVRDYKCRILGFMVRRDDSEPKYLWFSSASRPEGATSGAPVHFSRPQLVNKLMFITEGALKADVISSRLRAPVIGLPGVTNWPKDFGRSLRRNFPYVSELHLCFDSDFRTNETVMRGLMNLTNDLRMAGYSPRMLVWNAEAKGLDDYLTRKVIET